MSFLAAILRFFSYLYHLVLSAFLLGVASIALIGGQHNLRMDMLPWTGKSLTWWMLGLGLAGLISVVLAVMGKVRLLFSVWALVSLVLILKGYFVSSYSFKSEEEFRFAALLAIGGALALLGSLTQFRKTKRR